jgi:glutathione gamma-glutamylcysteinyltransferase
MSDKAQGFVITNFSRKTLGQTGDGHFSPIGGINLSRNLVLVLDVARFKYPPYWVNIEDLWKSMSVKDATTNEPRGYFLVGTSDSCTGGDDVIKRTTADNL